MNLTEKARLKAVLAKEKTDRPPVICSGGMMSAATTAVLSDFTNNFHNDPVIMAQVAERIRLNTGFENLGVPFCMTVEAEVFGSTVDLGDAGVEPCITEYGAGELAAITDRPLPDPLTAGRSPVILAAIRELSARNQDIPIIGNITGPISLTTSIIDPLRFFRLMRKAPAEVSATLDYVTNYLVTFAQAQIAAGADVIAIADPTATGEILGNVNFQRFVTPMLLRLVREIKNAGAGVIVHICGDATVLLDSLRELNGAVLSFDSIVNLPKAKVVLEDIPVMGNINTQMLHTGEPQRISSHVENLLTQGIDIIAPACGISLATPQINLRALTTVVKRFGR
ncbi:Uroporphyrinogen decarboxylase [Sporomusa silvacetica DSM 10669]|uniref:Uroporphyrinogen decarboxylase n=1 Tax=Sporomusa silvacetica DSM 10669 TaxID=1123289 RepID=A0ABZ3IGU5_9FIRM|nr:uroporphyrinogen decarboxylase family protein [Sporomusa silvacetica]OZC21466.1 uroporphyrinogen decarboxylase [Sporomusa silvacetica DSM 10669]